MFLTLLKIYIFLGINDLLKVQKKSCPDLEAEFINSERVKKTIIINYTPTHPNSPCGRSWSICFYHNFASFNRPGAFREGWLCERLTSARTAFLLTFRIFLSKGSAIELNSLLPSELEVIKADGAKTPPSNYVFGSGYGLKHFMIKVILIANHYKDWIPNYFYLTELLTCYIFMSTFKL